jgi:hypothetical protein
MKTLLLATALSLSMGVAYADGGGTGPTMFTMIEAQLAAKAQGAPPPVRVTPATGAATYVYSPAHIARALGCSRRAMAAALTTNSLQAGW